MYHVKIMDMFLYVWPAKVSENDLLCVFPQRSYGSIWHGSILHYMFDRFSREILKWGVLLCERHRENNNYPEDNYPVLDVYRSAHGRVTTSYHCCINATTGYKIVPKNTWNTCAILAHESVIQCT